jgi:hypothetical protein
MLFVPFDSARPVRVGFTIHMYTIRAAFVKRLSAAALEKDGKILQVRG